MEIEDTRGNGARSKDPKANTQSRIGRRNQSSNLSEFLSGGKQSHSSRSRTNRSPLSRNLFVKSDYEHFEPKKLDVHGVRSSVEKDRIAQLIVPPNQQLGIPNVMVKKLSSKSKTTTDFD